MLSLAQCAHVRGNLELARSLYERAIAIVTNSETSVLTLASVAMTSEEVHVGALAGLGQLESHLGYIFFAFALRTGQKSGFHGCFVVEQWHGKFYRCSHS